MASHKPEGPPPKLPAPETNPQPAEVAKLQALARAAYAKANYVIPTDSSSIAFSKRVLALNPSDKYAQTLLADSVAGGKYQAQQAALHKDFATAHRVANALSQLLPGRSDIVELQKDISSAEKASQPAPAQAAPAPAFSLLVYHMHTEKAPADHGPYCLGTLSVLAQRIKFKGGSASDGQLHNLDIPCSDVREIKKNSRVAAKEGGFHVRTTSVNFNFAPQDGSPTQAASLASACSK